MEQIFRLGQADYLDVYGNLIEVPTEQTEYEEEPTDWFDRPLTPTHELPYCYACYRHYSKDKKWHGQARTEGVGEVPIIWDRYVEDGKSPVVLTIANDNISTLVKTGVTEGKTYEYALTEDIETSTPVLSYGLTAITAFDSVEFSNDYQKIVDGGGAVEFIKETQTTKQCIRTTIVKGMDLTDVNDIQVDITGHTENNETIIAEGHITITKVASTHLYEVATSRDTIHKTSDDKMIEGQSSIYVMLQRQESNGEIKRIDYASLQNCGDIKVTYKVDNEDAEIPSFKNCKYGDIPAVIE